VIGQELAVFSVILVLGEGDEGPATPLPPVFLQKSAIVADSKRLDVFSGSQERAKVVNEGV
jgi:hypothetical protein